MKGIVLCAVLLVFLARNHSHGASTDMDFMKDPNFPGNPGWMKNLEESLPMNKPGFPGSPEWNRKFEEEMHGASTGMDFMKDPNFPGNPGWMKNLEESLPMNKPGFPGSPEWNRKFEEEMHGASTGMDFMKDPNFPGNPGWMKNLEESLPMNKPGFPGSPEWNRKFEEEMHGASTGMDFMKDPNFPGNPGWIKNLEESLPMNKPGFPGSPEWNRKFEEEMTPTAYTIDSKIKKPKPPKVKPVKPLKPYRPLLKPTAPVTFVGDKDRNIMTNMQNSNIGENFVISPAVQNAPSPVKPTAYEGPNLKHMKIPHAPQNFPFPPDCVAVTDPGYKFKDLTEMFKNNNFGNQNQVTGTKHRSFLCTDPEYGQDSFYMQLTEYSHGTHSGVSRTAIFYDKTGKNIDYSRKMVMLPLGESLPDTPRNDYLGMDVTF